MERVLASSKIREHQMKIIQRREISKKNLQAMREGKPNESFVPSNLIQENSWDKIVSNIATKDSDYPGSKEVQRMRASIINRKNDFAVAK